MYANLSHRRRTKKDAAARARAEYLATLPKHPVKRFFYRLHPKRVAKYWFSKRGAMMALKIVGVTALVLAIAVGGLFAYFRKDLDQIRPSELAKRVQSSINKYYDRNGQLLWEDKGQGNYKLVVESKDISDYAKKATVAIEDRDFYKHHGVSPSGLARATFNNLGGGTGGVQGGSTLTQQLVKQVFFSDEALKRGLDGIPRKIKEVVLAIEVERMYDKDQILTLYLNESPYGGPRNGIESGAQAYFNKTAKDLTLPEAALLAAIPQSPKLFDPYNQAGHRSLIARQHHVLDAMNEVGYISKQEAEAAKKVAILDTIRPRSDQFANTRAPHFVQMVRGELEERLGKTTVGRGGLTIKTSLDLRIQERLEQAMADMFRSSVPNYAGFSNGAGTLIDAQTGQIVAMLGSRSFEAAGFGQDNAALAYIQPGSSIKPLVLAELLKGNYGTGSVLSDSPTNFGGYKPENADRKFRGNISLRDSLAQSRNVPFVKAMQITGVGPALENVRAMGDKQYCTQGVEAQAGLSSALGSCGTRQVDHVNAFATLARMGVYKPHTGVVEVKNGQNETLIAWRDDSQQVVDPQITYIINEILTDHNARRPLIGGVTAGFLVPGVKTATKTGTSDIGGKAKDLWMMSYSPVLSMGVWLGNSDTRALRNGNSTLPGPIISNVMQYAHDIYKQEGRYTTNQWFSRPNGIQQIGNHLYPGWYDKSRGATRIKMTFDRKSKKKATTCTPENSRIEIEVTKQIDPSTRRELIIAPDGYNPNAEDDVHKCNDSKPSVSLGNITRVGGSYKITVDYRRGSNDLANLDVVVGGRNVGGVRVTNSGSKDFTYTPTTTGTQTITVTLRDTAGYSDTDTRAYEFETRQSALGHDSVVGTPVRR